MATKLRRAIALCLMVVALGIASCGSDSDIPVVLIAPDETAPAAHPLVGAIAEVSPPERIQQLKPYLDVYEPQVRIASPDQDATLVSTSIQVDLQIRDFPIYKDQQIGLGPHLHLFLDDQPHQAIYDADTSITLADLAPGTHTLRLLAVRPWGESFKNAGAYDQVTFNVFAASPQNKPDESKPVLTYNQPQNSYGAEPILLDFYLSNAPPHLVAQTDETIDDWRIRCTVNGESFVFDRWQPIYLKGLKPGKNWVKLELIDDNGNLIDNAFSTGLRVIDYQPGGEDGLSQLVRGEISLDQAKVLVDASYEPPVLTIENSIDVIAPDQASESVTATDSDEAASAFTTDESAASEAKPESLATPASADGLDNPLEEAPAKLLEEGNSAATSTPEAVDETPAAAEAEENLGEISPLDLPGGATDSVPGENIDIEAADSDRPQPTSSTSQPITTNSLGNSNDDAQSEPMIKAASEEDTAEEAPEDEMLKGTTGDSGQPAATLN
ncbi:MAG: hypothetical protein AAF827_09110, partial [Cyanobacteria bacterium P01_D01_bin.6]